MRTNALTPTWCRKARQDITCQFPEGAKYHVQDVTKVFQICYHPPKIHSHRPAVCRQALFHSWLGKSICQSSKQLYNHLEPSLGCTASRWPREILMEKVKLGLGLELLRQCLPSVHEAVGSSAPQRERHEKESWIEVTHPVWVGPSGRLDCNTVVHSTAAKARSTYSHHPRGSVPCSATATE